MENEHKTRGFTLIETLVVIVLISTLAALLFPVFSAARGQARKPVCASNLRQIGQAVFIYAGDFDDNYPYATDAQDKFTTCAGRTPEGDSVPLIHTVLAVYVKEPAIWRCPMDKGIPNPVGSPSEASECDLPGTANVFNAYGSSYTYRNDYAREHIGVPAVGFNLGPPVAEVGSSGMDLSFDVHGAWHGGQPFEEKRFNTLMADGHTQLLTYSALAIKEAYVVRQPR